MKRIVPVLIGLIIPFAAYSQVLTDTIEISVSPVVEEQVVEPVEAQTVEPAVEQAEEAVAEEVVELNADGLADDGSIQKYRRSSLYSVIIEHPSFPYGNEIDQAFFAMPMPDKFNEHNLGSRAIVSSMEKMKKGGKMKEGTNLADIDAFIEDYAIGKELVAKWFNRNNYTGAFNMKLIQERGFYDASQADIEAANLTTRKLSSLGDAGEDLIGKTFMIVNDITFVDKGENSAKAATVLSGIGRFLGALLDSEAVSAAGDAIALGVNEIDGFTVNVTTYLYRLVWNEDVAGMFYSQYWIDDNYLDADRKLAFDNSDIFKLQYIGQSKATAQNTASKSFSKLSKNEQMVNVCTRVVDKAIVELQRTYDEFKVNVPISKVNDNNTVEVQIGLKEGVTEKSRYEVLMAKKDQYGNVTYNRIGLLAPVKGQIWDNRYGALDEAIMAQEAGEEVKKQDGEEDGNAFLTATTFRIIEGGNKILPGSLVRECRIK